MQPKRLSEIVGQPAVHRLVELAADPFESCWLLEGQPGIGKSASALALANELGCEDEFSGLWIVPASELSIERCRDYFENLLRFRPLHGSGWKVFLVEELDGLTSKQVERYLKVNLERLPPRTIVVATSNGAGGLDRALLQRFEVLCYSSGEHFKEACQARLEALWNEATHRATMPYDAAFWGTNPGGEFSMRLAMRCLERALSQKRRAA